MRLHPAFLNAITTPLLLGILLNQSAAQKIELDDVTAKTGIRFQHDDGSTGKHLMLESMTGGLCLFDYDCDGDLDIYFLNGCQLDKAPAQPQQPSKNPTNALYRNDGNLRFVDVTGDAGLADLGFGLGVAVGDYDNDGDPDLFVNNYGPNCLFTNNGDGTFSKSSQHQDLLAGARAGSGASFFDADNDGDLDLYLGNHIEFDPLTQPPHMLKGLPAYPGPLKFAADTDRLLENLGDGQFKDISESAGITTAAGRSMGLVTLDYDQDGDADVIIANDSQQNFLFENLGQNQFEEVGLLAGIAFDFRGNSQASMGISQADFDGDGKLDLYTTSLDNELALLYRNLGDGLFQDVTRLTQAGEATYPHVTWGVAPADFNGDGWLDIYVACGHLDDLLQKRGGGNSATGFAVEDIVLLNQGSGQFVDLANDWGTGSTRIETGRGAVAVDLDGDLDSDIVVLNSRSSPTILQNNSTTKWEATSLELVGSSCNRSGLGAVARMKLASNTQTRTRASGTSYQCDQRGPLTFWLPKKSSVEVEIQWPGGESQVVTIESGRAYLLVQGQQIQLLEQ